MFSLSNILQTCSAAFLLAALLLPARACPCLAEENESTGPEVRKISVEGNRAIEKEELLQVMSTTKGKPFVQEIFDRDMALIAKLYAYRGYFETVVDTSVSSREKDGKILIGITIEENMPALIDSVSHLGLEAIPDTLKNAYLSGTAIHTDSVFTVDALIEERDRTIDFFREYGYAFMDEDSIRIQVDTTSANAGVLVNVRLPGILHYGPVRAIVHDNLTSDEPSGLRTVRRDDIDIDIYGGQKMSPKLVTSLTAYRPGNITRQSLQQKTLRNFGATNVFSSIFIKKDSVSDGMLHTSLHLEPKPKHLLEPKIFADNRYGDLFLGASVKYENKNLFGAAENLTVKTDFGMQLGESNDLLDNLEEDQYSAYRSYELGIAANLVKPDLERPGNLYTATAEYTRSRLPILLDNQKGLLRASYRAELTRKSRLNVDFFELEWVKKDSLDGFRQLFITDLAQRIDVDPLDEAAIDNSLDSLLQANINQTLRVQYYYSNRKVPERKFTYNWNASFEAVGSLAYLLDEYVDTGDYEGFTGGDPQIFGTPYSQFLKLSGQFSFARDLDEQQQIAGRVFLGAMTPYGKADDTPDERRFYAGGPNSMRGWLFNTLGPGGNGSEAAAGLGADIKIEANLEYRLKFFKLFGYPSGVALFTDVGNIWDRSGPYGLTLESFYRDIAWDAGLGLRIGSPIGPFRFDFAWKLYDPSQAESWQFSNWRPGDFTFNFGIGEAF